MHPLIPSIKIPELIKILKHSVHECDFLEIQSILMGLQSPAKLKLQKKLRKTRRKCKLLNQECEGLKQEKQDLNKALDDLRERNRESDALAKLYECKFGERIMKMEGALAKLFDVEVQDLAKLVATFDTKPAKLDSDPDDENLVCSPTEDDDGANTAPTCANESPCVEPHVSGDRNLVFSPTEDGDGADTAPTCANESPRVEPHVSEAGDVVVILDDDDDISPGYTTHVSDTSSEPKDKRKATGDDDSSINLIRKMKKGTCLSDKTQDDSQTYVDSTDSDEESSSYSDAYIEHLVATAQKIREI